MPTLRTSDELLARVRREVARARPVSTNARAVAETSGRKLGPRRWHLRSAIGVVAGLALVTSVALGARRLHGDGHARAADPVGAPRSEPSAGGPDFAALVSRGGVGRDPTRAPVADVEPTPRAVAPAVVPEQFTVDVINTGKTVTVVLGGPASEPDEASYLALRHELRSNSGAESPLDPRLIEILHQVAKRTTGTVQVISAFRPPKSRDDKNYHTRGMAADIRVAGMSASKLRDLVRTLGAKGIGYYPTSQFVHVDVRDQGFQWTDTSGPGQSQDDRAPENASPLDPEAHAAL